MEYTELKRLRKEQREYIFGLEFYRKRKRMTRVYDDTGGLLAINSLFPWKKKKIAILGG